ncbi:hypothetical protein Tco_0389800 [Tanacetum coccineum]
MASFTGGLINRSSISTDMILYCVEKMSEHVCRFSVSSESKHTQDTGYEFKHDYTIIESPRAVVFLVNNNDRKIMRFNEIYKFYDGTLTHILEALDYKVKEFKRSKKPAQFGAMKATKDEKDLPRTRNALVSGRGIVN